VDGSAGDAGEPALGQRKATRQKNRVAQGSPRPISHTAAEDHLSVRGQAEFFARLNARDGLNLFQNLVIAKALVDCLSHPFQKIILK
jgi:hypothetical protein